jgi:hypothetical protein
MNIISTGKYPSNSLSNFAAHPFMFRGLEVMSMEGFLQGLKYKNPDMQAHVFTLVGKAAKKKGSKKNWKRDFTLYFQGKAIDRLSDSYQSFLDEAYTTLAYNNDGFQRALLASGNGSLTHSIGRKKPKETILTQNEYCSRLMWIRDRLRSDSLEIIKWEEIVESNIDQDISESFDEIF